MVSLMLLTLTVSLVASDLASVLAQLVRGKADERALSVLQSAVKQDPSAPAWWVWLGYAHSLRGEWAQAAQAYGRAQQLGARSSFAWFPPSLPPTWLPEHGNLRSLTIAAVTVWQSPTVFVEPFPSTDPRHGERFHHITFVYALDRTDHMARQWVHWHAQAELPSFLADSPAVFALALKLLSERLGTSVSLPVRAWLFSRGDGSALSLQEHTFFYGLLPSDRWGWWRKVAHEAGHYTVPSFGEFEGLHEPYAGGFLGERLFALWLWEDGSFLADLRQPLSDYLRKTICAEIVRAQQWLLRPEGEVPPMPVFLGLCLFLERLGGHLLLREVVSNAPGDSWRAFCVGLERTFQKRLAKGLTIRLCTPDANTPLSAFDLTALREGLTAPSMQIAWWLLNGQFRCEVLVQGRGELQLRWGERVIAEWSVNADQPQKLSVGFVNDQVGWQRLRFWWLKGSGKIVSVTFLQE